MGPASFVKSILPSTAFNTFFFREDFDGDGESETVVIYSEETMSMPLTSVIWVSRYPGQDEAFRSQRLLYTGDDPGSLYDVDDDIYGGVFGAYAEDLDKDGLPELVVGLVVGSGHFLRVFAFKWVAGNPVLIYRSDEYAHGKFTVLDHDGDGSFEIVVEYSTYGGEEIIQTSEAGPHVRESLALRWDGARFAARPNQLNDHDECFRLGVEFVLAVWRQDYYAAYETVMLPQFLGSDGLDDDSIFAFDSFLKRRFRPALMANLAEGSLTPQEPCPGFCRLQGKLDLFTIFVQREHGRWRVSGVEVSRPVLT